MTHVLVIRVDGDCHVFTDFELASKLWVAILGLKEKRPYLDCSMTEESIIGDGEVLDLLVAEYEAEAQ